MRLLHAKFHTVHDTLNINGILHRLWQTCSHRLFFGQGAKILELTLMGVLTVTCAELHFV